MGNAEHVIVDLDNELEIIGYSKIFVSDEDRKIIVGLHQEMKLLRERYRRYEEGQDEEQVSGTEIIKVTNRFIRETDRLRDENGLSGTNYDVHPETGELVIYASAS